ncbi:MAG: RNA 2',3'-cyclic phosphodiesterase [Candidatus Omnitrophica bacterium]|nr:RNA 2',3'-cyclic phosphodiesterase [Candidatus Omnitrophota bacterium]
MAQDTFRLFLGISLIQTFEKEIEKLLKVFGPYSGQVQWANPSQMHLTLHFFGEVPVRQMDVFQVLLRNLTVRFRPFYLRLKDIGAFPNLAHPKILWVGIDGDLQELNDLEKAISLEMVRLGQEIERREFTPHLTLGRVRAGKRIRFEMPPDYQTYSSPGRHCVTEITLFKSELTPRGPVHTALEHFPLSYETK